MSEEATDRLRAAAENTLAKEGYTGQNFLEWRRASCSASLNGTSVSTKGEDGQWIQLILVPLSDYNTAMGTNETLSDGETLVYSYRADFSGDSMTINGEPYEHQKDTYRLFRRRRDQIKHDAVPDRRQFRTFSGRSTRLNTLADEIGARIAALWYYGFDAPLSPRKARASTRILRMSSTGALRINRSGAARARLTVRNSSASTAVCSSSV